MDKTKIIISGGGTGGHIFPAIAIAQALKRIDSDIEILFVGAKGKIEEKKVPEAGFKIKLLNIKGFARKFSLENIKNIFRLISSISKSKKIIRKFKPDVVVGVGGYASGPLVYAATQKRIPSLIQEQNSYPGITNKVLSKKAKIICVAYGKMDRFFPKEKIVNTGNPVRKKITNPNISKEEVLGFFDLEPDKKVILSLGGSGGAKSINDSIKQNINEIAKKDFYFIWQTGRNYYEDSLKAVEEAGAKNIIVYDFITRMDLAFKAADIVISRAGAGTISELCLLEKATILVPSPNVAEDHQTKNAISLKEKNAAIMVLDIEAKDKLIGEALKLIENPEKINSLSKNIAKEKVENSDTKIAKEVLKLVKKNKR
ncbi:MAG: undecaprenyldiphospho-muramoylpentapeptide beta-N-acetylglucosaminyltransferase [Bacteroidales bacterium]|nr:undecaprenyldiphospho-muramoylpentapeptide beta-N-acetylglucosaminyltransferase [Bacteroidales bacterium]